MTNEKRKTAIKWLQNEIRSLRLAPTINGCGPENWADLLEIMETCLEAVKGHGNKPLTLEQLREMVEKPAYLYIYDTALNSGWEIIKSVTEDKIIFRGWNTVYVPISSLGKCFDLYAYPPAHIDREAWEPCKLCGGAKYVYGHASAVVPSGDKGQIETEVEGDFDYCPECGRPLTDEAWAELEKRLSGVRV